MPGKTVHRYRTATCAMDMGVNPLSLARGVNARVYGADARYVGGIRPFPGMCRVTSFTDGGEALSNITFFRYAMLQKGTGTERLRGFVIRHGTSLSSQKVTYFYYDTETAAWGQYDIASSGISSTANMDIACNNRFLYVAIEGESGYPKVVWWETSAFTQDSMGPAGETAPAAPSLDSVSGTGGHLADGTYLVAYRYYNSTRDVYSGMSDPLSVSVSEGTGTAKIALSAIGGGITAFDKVQLFRTVHIEAAGTTYDGGVLFKESEISVGGTGELGTMLDQTLVSEERHDPWTDVVEEPPNTGAIGLYQGTTFMAAGDVDGIQWSSLTRYDPETFDSVKRLYRGRLSDGPVLRFVEAGDVCYALGQAVLYRIVKEGSGLYVNRLHYGRGLAGANGVAAVGEDILYASPMGIGILQGRRGTFRVFSSLDRLVLGDWADRMGDLQAATDTKLGVTFFVEPSTGIAVLVWHLAQLVTLCKDFYFTGATQGPETDTGDHVRAYFVTDSGLLLVTDHNPQMPDEGGTSTRTMLDVQGTVNGTATGGSQTSLEDSSASFDSTCVGARLWYVNERDEWISTEILARPDENTLTLGTQPETIASGMRYAISPVPFEVRLPPVPTRKEDADPLDPVFDRRVITEIGVKAILPTVHGFDDNDNAFWRVGAYKNFSDAPESTTDDIAIGDDDVHEHFGRVNVDGTLLEPYVSLVASGVNFELTGVRLGITITASSVPGASS